MSLSDIFNYIWHADLTILFLVIGGVIALFGLILAFAFALGIIGFVLDILSAVFTTISTVLTKAGELLGISSLLRARDNAEEGARIRNVRDEDARDEAIVTADNHQGLQEIGYMRAQAARDRIRTERRKKQRLTPSN
jgi:hypothetical protein